MIFDAFGRLALGQVKQDFGATTVFLTGVSANAQLGQLGHPTTGPQLTGVSGAGSAGNFLGGSTSTGGTPIGALLTITLGTPLSTGGGNIKIDKTLTGAAGTGTAGVEGHEVDAILSGVSAFGAVGGLGNAKFIPVTGVGAVSGLGTISVTATNFTFIGVAAVGQVGTIVVQTSGFSLVGVSGAGQAGTFNAGPYSGATVVSGGGGGAKPKAKMGLEPVKKLPPTKPEPIAPAPTYVLPRFAPRPKPVAAPAIRTPFEREPNVQPLDLMAMKRQIQEAQDETDIKAVLEFLDALD
jgi:hypothetical protein